MKNKSSNILTVEDVSYDINDITINKNINLNINFGEIVSIIGPNGSGKTTLLRLISGDILPSCGYIKFREKELNKYDSKEISTMRAVLPQNSYISFPFSVNEIIQMGRFPYPENKNLNKTIVDDLIKTFDLYEFLERDFTSLSGGEKQRVQLARVFAQIWSEDNYDGKLLVLDEPTSFLDIKHQLDFFKIINDFRNNGLTILMVLHDINHASSFSDKIAMMKNTELIYFGDTKDVMNSQNLNDVFDINLKLVNIDSNGKKLIYL